MGESDDLLGRSVVSLVAVSFLALLSMHPRKLLKHTLKLWNEYQTAIIMCIVVLIAFAVGALGRIAPPWQQLFLDTVRDWGYRGVNALPDTIMDGVVLYSVTYAINWVREELKKDDPVAQLFAGRMNTSLNLILPGGGLGLRTLSEDSVTEYFHSEEAQETILAEANAMRRSTPNYPYISLPLSAKKAFCDHVINKVSSMFAVEHVLADGCRRGDYVDEEFTFGLSFEVPADGNPNLIQQKFRLYIVRSSDLEQTVRTECSSPIPYFRGRWANLVTLHSIQAEAKTSPPPAKGEATPVWGTLRVPLPCTAPPPKAELESNRTGTIPMPLTLSKSRNALVVPGVPSSSPKGLKLLHKP